MTHVPDTEHLPPEQRECISIIALHLKVGGIERAICALANLLCADYDVEILSIYHLCDQPAFPLDERVRVLYLTEGLAPNRHEFLAALRAHRPLRLLREGLRALDVLRKRRRAIRAAARQASGQIIISTSELFHRALAQAQPRRVLIAWEHNDFRAWPRAIRRTLRSVRGFDYFVTVSASLAAFFAPRVDPTRCLYLPLPIDDLPPETAPEASLQIAAVGRLEPEKACDDLLRVFAQVRARCDGATLVLAGEGSERPALEELARQLGVASAVTFRGALTGTALEDLYRASALLVSTSRRESFGLVLLEAMRHGLPCLAYTSAAGAREIIEDGVNGRLIKERDSDALASAIAELLERPDPRLREGARATAARFTTGAVRDQWLAFCGEAAGALPKKTTVVFASSAGGHFAELRALAPLYERYNSYYISERNAALEAARPAYGGRLFLLAYGTKERFWSYPFVFSWNCLRSLQLFWRLRPDFVISTGAHTAVPLCYIAHWRRRGVIYFETYANITDRSLSGRLVYPIADLFFVQWEELLEFYPRAIYRGWLP